MDLKDPAVMEGVGKVKTLQHAAGHISFCKRVSQVVVDFDWSADAKAINPI